LSQKLNNSVGLSKRLYLKSSLRDLMCSVGRSFQRGGFVGGDPVRFNIDTLLNASHMKNLIELETEIKHLPEQEIRQLTERLQVYLDEKWDRQMESDLASGRLDNLIAKAEADIATHQVKDLDEVLHNP
jgi:hypothetical protein